MDILKNLSEIDWELQNTASANQRWKPYLIILQLTHENLSTFFFPYLKFSWSSFICEGSGDDDICVHRKQNSLQNDL